MDDKEVRDTVARLDAQMPLVQVQLSKMNTKVDKIDADQRKTMVLFEETDGKFKLTLEGYMSIGGRMDMLEVRMDKLEGRMDALEARMDKLEERMDKLEAEVRGLRTEMREGFEAIMRKMDDILGGRPEAGTVPAAA